ncbi:MAG: DUF3048 domain-containing protein [Anaerolineae bacterium]
MEGKRGWIWRAAGVTALLLLSALYLIACSESEQVTPTPTPTKTPRPTANLPQLPTATLTPVPSPTTVQTFTPTPTATQAPITATAVLTAVMEVGDVPWGTPGPDDCPLTGLPVDDPSLLERRPLAIKIQNATISRPQFGLPEADIVYEHLTEAGITRFTAIYLCQEVAKVGSTRSARFIDLEIPAMYDSLLAFSGTSAGLYPKFLNVDFYDREFCYGWGLHPEGFYRDRELREQGIPIEHTLFVDPAKIWETADELGVNERQELQGMHFSPEIPEDGQPASHIRIPYPHRDMIVDYRYDDDSGRYLRWDGNMPHVDAATGEQISVTNVIVVYANHVDTDIYEDEPRRNHPSVQIQLWGTGPAVVFRDGQAFEGLWARPKREDMLVLRDATGQMPIPLKPGNIWVQLVPLEGHRWAFEAGWDEDG